VLRGLFDRNASAIADSVDLGASVVDGVALGRVSDLEVRRRVVQPSNVRLQLAVLFGEVVPERADESDQ
jgi:hypothetical protein